MSKSGVQKHCSVLNYVRHADPDLYELIQDLCIGRIFVPKRGSPGITFLRPDKALLKEIQKMATGENPEEAVEALQSLVLLDNISSIKKFDDKKSDIPTYLRQKLPVMSADGKSVKLTNNAEIQIDKDFMSRGDRANISVYIISKALVPAKTEPADFSNAKVEKEKKGGADFGSSRSTMFEAVLTAMAGKTAEPAMDMLVELHCFLTKKGNSDLANLVASQCSYDAIASLACVLQPYKDDKHYIENDVVNEFRTHLYGESKNESYYTKQSEMFSLRENVAADYDKLVGTSCSGAAVVTDLVEKLSGAVGKFNIVKKIKEALGNQALSAALPGKRVNTTVQERFAEAELRVMSAILFDNDNNPDYEALVGLFKKCNLDKPHMLDAESLVNNSNVGFYYSTVYLIARSDLFCYLPGVAQGGVGLNKIFDEDNLVNVNGYFQEKRKAHRAASSENAKNNRAAIENLLKNA
jgi:hypothetical protein